MTPGLARGPPFPEAAIKDAVVAIASLENPSVPMVVGVCEIDITALGRVQGVKGHAVRTVHWDGDELWSWSPGGKPGSEPPDHIDGWDDGQYSLEQNVAGLDLEESETEQDQGGVFVNTDPDPSKTTKQNLYVDGEAVAERVAVEHEMTSKGA